jgi:hypothetical protein
LASSRCCLETKLSKHHDDRIVQNGVVVVGTLWPFNTGQQIYYPGQSVTVSLADYNRLVACGILQNPAEQIVPGPGGSTQIVPAA